MLRTKILLAVAGCLVLTAGCAGTGSAPGAQGGHHKIVASGKKADPSASDPSGSTPSGGTTSTGTPTTVSAAQWTCASAAPPAGAGGTVVLSAPATVGSERIEAAGQATTGCVALYTLAAGASAWQAQDVTSDASGGNGVSSLQVAAVDQDHVFVLATGLPGAGQAPAFLFMTADGGTTWVKGSTGAGSVLPHSNVPLQMAFSTAQDGWITDLNTFYGPPRVEVYATHDGGITWALTAFAVPDKYAAAFGAGQALPPVWQNAQQGTIKVFGTMNGVTTTLVYGTSDGGASWLLQSASQNSATGG